MGHKRGRIEEEDGRLGDSRAAGSREDTRKKSLPPASVQF